MEPTSYKKIDLQKVRDMYNNMSDVWPVSDTWYNYTYKQMFSYVNKYLKKSNLRENSQIVNIGSGGNEYNITGKHYHIDIAEEKIKHCSNYFIGNAETLPFEDNYFDFGICLGSVINYCDPFLVISEISRTLKPGATLIFDFEQSRSFQFIGTEKYNANATLIRSFNSGYEDFIWIFSMKHISSICKSYGLKISNVNFFHIFSPFIYRICLNEMFAAKFVFLDKILRKIPYIKQISCNVILTVQKSLK